jgi:hypothetical protein
MILDGELGVEVLVEALLGALASDDDPAVEDVLERQVLRFGFPVAHDLVALDAALYPQPLFVGRSAPEADAERGVSVLKALRHAEISSGRL